MPSLVLEEVKERVRKEKGGNTNSGFLGLRVIGRSGTMTFALLQTESLFHFLVAEAAVFFIASPRLGEHPLKGRVSGQHIRFPILSVKG